MKYIITNDRGDRQEVDAHSRGRALAIYVGGLPPVTETTVLDVQVHVRNEFTNRIGPPSHQTVIQHPAEPECFDDRGHRWTMVTAGYLTGGVRVEDKCTRCGARRVTRTDGPYHTVTFRDRPIRPG